MQPDADILVSIHCNAAGSAAKGTETFHCAGSSTGRKIAECVQRNLISALGTLDRGVKDDTKLLQNNQADFAKAIAKGLAEFFGLTLPAPDVIDTPAESPKNNLSDEQIKIIASLSAKFVDWLCKYPDDKLANYGRVLAAHKVNSPEFIRQWQDLGTIDPGNFGRLQNEYMVSVYYGGAADKLRKENFNLEKHSDALKAVVFSRAVQNGQTGCKDLFVIACKKLGQQNLSYIDDAFFDEKIISAIYDFLISECDLAMPIGGIWRSPDDFCHGGKNIIDALRSRFVREKQDALVLL